MPQPLSRSDQKKAAIIDAAVKCFTQNSFQATSMDQIAEVAQVSKRTVYNHFESKEGLFLAIAKHMFSLISDASQAKFSSTEPLTAQLTSLAKQEMALMANEDFMNLSRVTVNKAITDRDAVTQVMDKISELEASKTAWFKAAIQAGKLKAEDPLFLAHQFTGTIKGFCFWPQLIMRAPFPSDTEQAKIIETTVGMFLNYYQQPE